MLNIKLTRAIDISCILGPSRRYIQFQCVLISSSSSYSFIFISYSFIFISQSFLFSSLIILLVLLFLTIKSVLIYLISFPSYCLKPLSLNNQLPSYRCTKKCYFLYFTSKRVMDFKVNSFWFQKIFGFFFLFYSIHFLTCIFLGNEVLLMHVLL